MVTLTKKLSFLKRGRRKKPPPPPSSSSSSGGQLDEETTTRTALPQATAAAATAPRVGKYGFAVKSKLDGDARADAGGGSTESKIGDGGRHGGGGGAEIFSDTPSNVEAMRRITRSGLPDPKSMRHRAWIIITGVDGMIARREGEYDQLVGKSRVDVSCAFFRSLFGIGRAATGLDLPLASAMLLLFSSPPACACAFGIVIIICSLTRGVPLKLLFFSGKTIWTHEHTPPLKKDGTNPRVSNGRRAPHGLG